MKTVDKARLGLRGAAFLLMAFVVGTASCSSKSNPTPGNTAGASGHTGASGAGGGAGTGGAGGSAGTGGAAGTGGTAGAAPDGGAGASGDGGAACDASGLVQEAGCMACATDPLNSCGSVQTTCVPFDNSKIPANIPRL